MSVAEVVIMSEFEAIIGLEVHAQLLTESKMFCACSAAYGGEPNTQVCPVCLGLPGALPVVNETAVEFAVRVGLATSCSIASKSVFARKNYFYPDCPKNYQITQYDTPLCSNGVVFLSGRRIGIKRIHLEEDAGKLIHPEEKDYSLIDLNRCGVPLVEIVSDPDIRTPVEAAAFLQKIRSILRYLEICDGNMEEGSIRCDVNVSIRRRGEKTMGTKTEIKNLNSFKAIERALAHEIARQEQVYREGGRIEQDTLLWDDEADEARIMRTKEEVHDYRYFSEPDLFALGVSGADIERISSRLPELPDARMNRFVTLYALPPYDAGVLTSAKELADYFETAVDALGGDPKSVSNWIMGEVLRELKERRIDIMEFAIDPKDLARLIDVQKSGRINMPKAKEIFKVMAATGKGPEEIISEKGFEQISDKDKLEAVIEEVLDSFPDEVGKYIGGNERLLTFFIGQVMKKTQGRANPQKTTLLLRAMLDKRR